MPRGNGSTTDAIALLKADHRLVEELFEKFAKTNGSSKSTVVSVVSRRT